MVMLPEQGEKIKVFGSEDLVDPAPAIGAVVDRDGLHQVGRLPGLGVRQRVERDQASGRIGAIAQNLIGLGLQHVIELLARNEHGHDLVCGCVVWQEVAGAPPNHVVTLPRI